MNFKQWQKLPIEQRPKIWQQLVNQFVGKSRASRNPSPVDASGSVQRGLVHE